MRAAGLLCDIILVAESVEIPAHKATTSTRKDFFFLGGGLEYLLSRIEDLQKKKLFLNSCFEAEFSEVRRTGADSGQARSAPGI